ncbi:hypothetical protein BT69DRAFT_129596 [Atractiella rhizophila]|nr:hypothetical protein BT69DRAFT_129596 [Atractiella rhizophila]
MGMLNVGFLPGVFFGVLTAREYGGSGMIAIGWPLAGIFMTGLVTVLSEFSGAYPVAGAMFTWVFRLCRVTSSPFKGSARFLSWLAGSFLLCSHILAQVALSWQFAVVIQGCVKVYITSYQGTMWRTVAIAWGNIFFCAAFVSMPVSRSPYLWRCAGCLLIFAFLFFNISLLAAAPNKRSAYDIFTSYENDTGFSTKGYVYLLGWVLTTLATGMDACAHMAEETRAPARTVPSSMFWTSVGSYIMGWISLCVYLACDNTPPPGSNRADSGEAVVNVTPTVEISWEPSRILITNLSPALTVTTLALILTVMILQDIAQLLASSRFVWALARDKAIPLSPFFRRLSKNLLPLHATWVVGSVVFLCVLLITVNRDLVNNLMLKGTGVAIFIAYIFPVIVYLCCDSDSLVVDGRNLWTVRGFVRPLSYVSTLFVVFILVCMSFPTNLPLTALTFPWAPVVGIGVLCLSTLSWIFYGNSRYAGPIKATLGPSVELPKSQPRSSRPDDNSNSSEDRHGKTAQVWVRSLSTIHTSGEQLHEITSVTHQPKFEYQGRIQRIPPPGLPKDEEAVAIAVETERRIQRLQPPGHAQENLGVDSVDAEREGFPWNILSR